MTSTRFGFHFFLVLLCSKSTSELIHVLVEQTLDWIDWMPLPRLTPPESCFHCFGLDHLQAFALFHSVPIWIALPTIAAHTVTCQLDNVPLLGIPCQCSP